MISPYLSRKIRNISLLLMVMVAFIHGYNVNLAFSDGVRVAPAFWTRFLQGFLSDGVCRVAVPMFFAISGFLAAESLGESPTLRDFGRLLKKRVRSLLVPYLLVSALGIATVVVLQLIPFSRPFFNHFSLSHTSFRQWIWIWMLSPVPYPLWFIRFLMDYFLFLPVLYVLLRLFRIPGLVFLFFLWAYQPIHAHIYGWWKAPFSLASLGFSALSGTPFSTYLIASKIELEGLFFFALGVFASQTELPLEYRPKKQALWVFTSLWLVWIGYRTWLALQPDLDHYNVHYHLVGFTLVGFFIFWFLYDVLDPRLQAWKDFPIWASFSIGIFLFHEPFLTMVKKGLIRVLGTGDASLTLVYGVAPVLGLAFSGLVSRLLSRKLPRVYSWLTGNRNPDRPSS